MRRRIAEQIDRLIERHGLHREGAPVDLSPLKEEFIKLIAPIEDAEIPAFAIPPLSGEVSIHSPAFVILNEMYPENWQKLYYAHEVGHVLCGHVGTLRVLDAGPWWFSRDEVEAWEAAARLLIPVDEVEPGATFTDVARFCRVPVWLAEHYPVGLLLQSA